MRSYQKANVHKSHILNVQDINKPRNICCAQNSGVIPVRTGQNGLKLKSRRRFNKVIIYTDVAKICQ